MRQAAENGLARYAKFSSINATAESSNLPNQCVDMITVGQAYHWLERKSAKQEFQRILKPGGSIVLIWNARDPQDPFIQAFDTLISTFSSDFSEMSHTKMDKLADMTEFVAPAELNKAVFPNQQIFDFAGLTGRLLSSSYAPSPDNPNYEP
ncbi:MAG: class I SAM-dependent methyltransferase [Chloroflexota bacterium]